jgi:hypothetical protein
LFEFGAAVAAVQVSRPGSFPRDENWEKAHCQFLGRKCDEDIRVGYGCDEFTHIGSVGENAPNVDLVAVKGAEIPWKTKAKSIKAPPLK